MRVLLIDDHPLYRQALGIHLAALDAKMEIIEAANCAQALAAAPVRRNVDLILLDLALSNENGLDHIAQLRRRFPAAAVVVISASDDTVHVQTAMAHGVAGYIHKSATADNIRAALRIVMNGGTYVPEFNSVRSTSTELTARQLQILARVTQGHSNKRIAHDLGVAEATVRAHMTQVLKALRVSNRTEAGYAAITRGLLTPVGGPTKL